MLKYEIQLPPNMDTKIVLMVMLMTAFANVASPLITEDNTETFVIENTIPDSDNDGINDYADQFPTNANESRDTDGDGWGDNEDYCPRIPDSTNADFDEDNIGDVCDFDDDNDGIADKYDINPLGNAFKNYTVIMVATTLMDSQRNQPDEPFMVIETPFFSMRTHNHSGYMANASFEIDVNDHINSQVMVNISAWDSDYGVNEDDYYGDCLLYLPALNSCRGDDMRVLGVDTYALLNDAETQEQVSIWVNSESPQPKDVLMAGGFFNNLWNNLVGIFDGFLTVDDAEGMAIDWIINTFVSYGGTLLLL